MKKIKQKTLQLITEQNKTKQSKPKQNELKPQIGLAKEGDIYQECDLGQERGLHSSSATCLD